MSNGGTNGGTNVAEAEAEAEASMTLGEFLATSGTLTAAERITIARQALVVLEHNYAHLPLKAARYAVNPLQRLRLFISRLGRSTTLEPEWRFHAEMLDIFGSVRDLHTRYVLPDPFAKAFASLPFLIKDFVEDGVRHFVVAPLADGSAGTLPAGAEVVTWNGVPIERALDLFGNRLPGANPAARRARALSSLTVRSLGFTGPPDDEFVLIQYVDLDGEAKETREAWKVTLPPPVPPTGAPSAPVEEGPDLELDIESARVAWLRTELFAPHVLDLVESGGPEVAVSGEDGIPVPRELATSLEARIIPGLLPETPEIGHLRIRNFTPPSLASFVKEFIRLLDLMPAHGVIVDIRGNGGGSPIAAELCLQAMTARRIESQPLQFICSPLNLSICRSTTAPGGEDLSAWVPSMEQAVESGAVYSAGVARTSPELLAAVPQAYFGPVVLLIDARVYSAADRFAAGFQDNEIGPVLGVDANTGAGGANVWKHADLLGALAGNPDSPYRPLPAGTVMTVAIRRTLRIGGHTGVPVEDFGVEPTEVHHPTRADVLNQSIDLMTHAARLLAAAAPPRQFDVEVEESAESLTVRFEVDHIDRADVFVDGRPRESVDLADGTTSASFSRVGTPTEVRVSGFAAGKPVALRIFRRDQQGVLVALTTFG